MDSASSRSARTLGRALRGLAGLLDRVLDGLLVSLLTGMMVIAVGQIALRIFFNSGFVWADELLKLMVLWIAMIASVAASRSDRHLRIDVLSHFVPPRIARLPRMIVDGFAAFICGLVAWESYRYVKLNIEFGDTVLVAFPAWVANGIVPVAFALMSCQFLVLCLTEILALARPPSATTAGDIVE